MEILPNKESCPGMGVGGGDFWSNISKFGQGSEKSRVHGANDSIDLTVYQWKDPSMTRVMVLMLIMFILHSSLPHKHILNFAKKVDSMYQTEGGVAGNYYVFDTKRWIAEGLQFSPSIKNRRSPPRLLLNTLKLNRIQWLFSPTSNTIQWGSAMNVLGCLMRLALWHLINITTVMQPSTTLAIEYVDQSSCFASDSVSLDLTSLQSSWLHKRRIWWELLLVTWHMENRKMFYIKTFTNPRSYLQNNLFVTNY